MPIHVIRLINQRPITKETIELVFEKPAGFTFKPGQYAGFTLINPPETDAGGITRRFSFLNAPQEEYIRIATRFQNSAYKRVLCSLPVGGEVKLAGPTGNFTLHEDITIPAVFIAGGIGVTPFYSMIQHAFLHKSPQELYLFYGNQSPKDAAYLDELLALQTKHPTLKIIPTMAKPDNSWTGETGFVDEKMIKKYISDLKSPIFYICGSPAMVTALQETLMEMGVASDRIKIEDFPGY